MTLRMLVALHPGHTHTPALERALALCAARDAEVMLYSAVYDEHVAGIRFGDGSHMKEARSHLLALEQNNLLEIKQQFLELTKKVEVRADWHHPAAHGIVAAAQDYQANLIVVSSTQRNRMSRWLLTNTDWEVLRHTTIPVLFAHHRPFQPYKTVLSAVNPLRVHDDKANLDDCIVKEGLRLGELFDGKLHLIHAFPSYRTLLSPESVPSDAVLESWRMEHSNALQNLAHSNNIPSARLHLLEEYPSRAIPDIAKTLSADLVVMGSVSHGALERAWIGPTTERTLDHLECDVLTVRVARDS